jgi:hypothetical protein
MCAIYGSVGLGLCAEAMPDASSKAANAPANLTNTMMNLPVAATMAVLCTAIGCSSGAKVPGILSAEVPRPHTSTELRKSRIRTKVALHTIHALAAAPCSLRRSPRLLPQTRESHEKAHVQRLARDCGLQAQLFANSRSVAEGLRGRARLGAFINSARIAGSQRTDPRATSRTAIILQPI